jgi:hypothetical protein
VALAIKQKMLRKVSDREDGAIGRSVDGHADLICASLHIVL